MRRLDSVASSTQTGISADNLGRYKQYDANYPDEQREEETNLDVDLRTRHLSSISEVSSVAEIIHGGCLYTFAEQ